MTVEAHGSPQIGFRRFRLFHRLFAVFAVTDRPPQIRFGRFFLRFLLRQLLSDAQGWNDRPSSEIFCDGITRPGSGGCAAGVFRTAFDSTDREFDIAGEEFPTGALWLTGMLVGAGVLGILVCDTLGALEAALGAAAGAGWVAGDGAAAAGAGLGAGLVAALCCANEREENRRTTAKVRPESPIKHLLTI
jgi:hypothetical protein